MKTPPGRVQYKATASQLEAVSRAEAYMRRHLDGTPPLGRLCRLTGLSERSLRNAFYSVYGMSPTRYMRVLRLRGVHRALREGPSNRATVTTVATHYGFYELGRFAGTYRAAFGETPSDTLRRYDRRTERKSLPDAKGNGDVCTT
jgi:AraC family ethanolamine operon transcriptional activator